MDLVEIGRIERALDRSPGFAERVFTDYEHRYCLDSVNPAERFAARFAAKEAVLKVLGTGLGGTSFRSIEVRSLESGQPTITVGGSGAVLAEQFGIVGWMVTLTHSDLTAGAVVVGLGTP